MAEGRKASRLDLSNVLADLDDDLELYKEAQKSALETLRRMGFTPTPRPKRKGEGLFPELPENVSDLPNTEVTDLQSGFVIVYSYAKDMTTLSRVMAESYEAQAKHIRKLIKKATSGSVDFKNDVSSTDPRYAALNAMAIKWKGVADFLAGRCDALDKARAVCSRDVEFRTREWEQYQRDRNIRNRRRGQRPFKDPEGFNEEED